MDQENRDETTLAPGFDPNTAKCVGGTRLCENGKCVPKSDLCPQEEEMNENTILIMVIIGAAVLIFLVILYCFQQRAQNSHRNNANPGTFESIVGDGDNASLNMPPPTYNEVISTDLYPPTPNMQRSTRISASEEPITPPPNYDAALHILARSHENICTVKSETPVIRRTLSSDIYSSARRSPNGVSEADLQRTFSSSEDRP